MKYGNLIVAFVFALTGVAQADSDTTVSKSEISDYKVECIGEAIADELPDAQRPEFVEQCLQQKLAAARSAKQKRS